MLPRAKKSFGQNFLIDQGVVEKIVVAAEIKKGEHVLEIGPGTGVLTQTLVNAGAHVTAIELDHDLIENLREKFGDQIELIEGDVLNDLVTQRLNNFPFKLIANIPYNITSPIIEKFLAHGPFPTQMILMVQREVADRILAKPPEMSLLSVACQLYADCVRVTNVKAGAFRPIPKVDSAVVRFVVAEKQSSKVAKLEIDPESVIAFAKAGFSSRRKQLHHNLLPFLKRFQSDITSDDVKNILVSIHLDPKVRAENLTIQNWIDLAKVFPTAM